MTLVWADEVPNSAEYRALRDACGLGHRCADAARLGLPNSCFAVTGRTNGTLIAMGRIVGDGGAFCQVVDVAVHPDWQGQGLGQVVMTRLMAWCANHLPATCHISLVSSERAVPLYESHGFQATRGMDRYAGPNL
jgi:GNAT superfamily N-acetyltransferase